MGSTFSRNMPIKVVNSDTMENPEDNVRCEYLDGAKEKAFIQRDTFERQKTSASIQSTHDSSKRSSLSQVSSITTINLKIQRKTPTLEQ